jgi:hypothetical protein
MTNESTAHSGETAGPGFYHVAIVGACSSCARGFQSVDATGQRSLGCARE